MKRILMLTISFLLLEGVAEAQAFSSGSTGADGPLDLSSMSCPNNTCTVQLPESGVLNYTTVSIPGGKTLVFARNSRNTPVYMLMQGNATIGGAIVVSAAGEFVPGPGGFYGGQPGQPGSGPGGGQFPLGTGAWIGALSLVPIVGGSGGGGQTSTFYGSGGGGAIVLASSTSITFSGQILANGGCNVSCGSGGAIRVVANSISASGEFQACAGGGTTACGVVRLEAPQGHLTFTGVSRPAAVLSTINAVVTSSTPPSMTIVSVGGFAVPSYAGQRFNTVDILLPNQLPDPITVLVQGNNIPVGTQVTVGFLNGSPNATTTPATLQGTFASSIASPSVSNLNRTSVTYLLASATFDPPQNAPSNLKGANHVDKVRVESAIGSKSKFVFLRKDGSEINPEMLAREFLQQFGQ